MKFHINFSDFVFKEKKVLYLILFLPLTLFIGSAITNIFIFSIVIIFLIECKKKNNFFFLKNKNFQFLIIFTFYLILNSLFLGKNLESISRAVGFLRYIILAFAIAYYLSLESRKYEKSVFKFWVLIFLFVTFDLFFEYFLGYNFFTMYSSEYPGRLGGLTGTELKIGGYYFGFALLSFAFVSGYNKNKILYLFFIIFLVVALLIGERSNFLKILIISSIFILFLKKKSIIKNLTFLIIFIIFGFIFIMNNQSFKLRYYQQIIGLKNDIKIIKTNKHLENYATAIQVIKKNPIFGVGVKKYRYESFKKEYNQYKNITFNGMGNHPHQIHFELLAELGLVGYIPLITYLIYFIVKSFNSFRKNNNFYLLGSTLFIFASILPIIPSGSFFTTYTATIFWINYSIALSSGSAFNIK